MRPLQPMTSRRFTTETTTTRTFSVTLSECELTEIVTEWVRRTLSASGPLHTIEVEFDAGGCKVLATSSNTL